MKRRFLAFLLVLPMLAFCDTPITPEQGEENPGQTEQPSDNPNDKPAVTDTVTTQDPPATDVVELAPEITNGSVVLACNPNVHKFLTEVTYPDHDYSYTKILDYYGGYNGNLGEGETVKSDKPSEYTIRWTADAAAGDLTLELSEPTWSMTETITAGGYYVNVSNLVPNTHYTYKVTAANGTVMTEGQFDTYGSIHQVYFKHSVRNSRDLGGWLTYDGKMVKYRMIYRGGRLQSSTISKSGKKAILDEGIKAQLDIRGESDVNSSATLPEFDFCAPIIATGGDSMLKADGGDKMRQCMQFVIDCVKEDKPVFFHCSLGRDRTGTLALIILGLLDVVEGDISKEYEVTYFSPRGWSIATSETYSKFQNYRTKWAYAPAANHIWDNYVAEGERFSAGVEKYLLEIGISQEDINTFRELMLVEAYPDLTPAE